MSLAKSLTTEQISNIQTWADDGANLSDIQKRMADEMEVKITYMEMRFLIEDIGVTFPAPPVVEPEPDETATEQFSEINTVDSQPTTEQALPPEDQPATANVIVDDTPRPEMIVSGKVTFNGGKTLGWYLDQHGRLGVDPGVDADFHPTEAQLQIFQTELQIVLKEKGFG